MTRPGAEEFHEFDWDRYESELTHADPPGECVPVPAPWPRPDGADASNLDAIDDGATLLDELHAVLCRYLVMPSGEATDAVVLWIAATHGQPAWEHATRLGITGPARRCGKSRLLEIAKATSHKPLPAVNATPAAMYRSIASDEPPTILLDEADTQFGTKRAADANEDLRALLNAGHSRGWPILRCVGPNQDVRAFPSFAMAALAGIGDLPDTITDRAINIRMRRRAPAERVAPFRIARDTPALHALRGRLHRWVRAHLDELRDAEPDMPVEDRAADTWESLIAIADLAGGGWPDRARTAAKILTADTDDPDGTLSMRLLADLRAVFGTTAALHTATILDRLHGIDDAPWSGRNLTAHDLARMLRPFGIKSTDVRENGGPNRKGYHAADLYDTFTRYLPPDTYRPVISVADVADSGLYPRQETPPLTGAVADVADVADPPPERDPEPRGDAADDPDHQEGGTR